MADEDSPMAVSEDDVTEMCRMGIGAVKTMIRPDTTRIGKCFDVMMDGVKRRSTERQQDLTIAIERCFMAFSGRRKKSLRIQEFARRLSVLSMEWSGNFSMEEFLALAQDIGDQNMPGMVTLESFKWAANVGPTAFVPEYAPRWRRNGDQNSGGSRDECQIKVNGFDDKFRDGERGSAAEDGLESTLRQAASKARSAGKNVWKLLDASVKGSLAEVHSDEDEEDDTPTGGQEQAPRPSLSPEALRRFLSRLEVRVLQSPPRPPSLLSAPVIAGQAEPCLHHKAGEPQQQPAEQASDSLGAENRHDGNRSAAIERPEDAGGEVELVSSFSSTRKLFEENCRRKTIEDNQRKFRGGRPVKVGSLAPSLPPPERAVEATAPEVADRYLQVISRDTASVRCRLQFYNSELARTGGEAQSLVRRMEPPPEESSHRSASSVSLTSLPLPPPPPLADPSVNGNCGFEQSPQLPPDMNTHRSLPPPSPSGVESKTGRRAGGDGLVISIAAEVGGRTAILSGGRAGRGALSISPTGSIVSFARFSPIDKADPSHPRIEITPRSRSSPSSPSPSTHAGRAQQPGRGGASPPGSTGGSGSGSGGGGGGDQGAIFSAAVSPRNSDGDEIKVAASPSKLVSKLLVSALKDTRGKIGTSPLVPSPGAASVERRKIAVVPKVDRFDPPSARNGLTGLTTDQVEGVLLRVEDSVPGAVSSWKSTVGRAGNGRSGAQTRGKVTSSSTISDSRRLIVEAKQQQRRRQAETSKGKGVRSGNLGTPSGARPRGRRQGMGTGGARGGARGGAGEERGARSIRSILRDRRPAWGRANGPGAAQEHSMELSSTWGIAPTEWESHGREEASEEIAAKNPIYSHSLERVVAEKKEHVLQGTLSAASESITTTAVASAKRASSSRAYPHEPLVEEHSVDKGRPGYDDSNSRRRKDDAVRPPRGSATTPRSSEPPRKDIYAETLGSSATGGDTSVSSLFRSLDRGSAARRRGRPAAGRTFQGLGAELYEDFVDSTKLNTELSGFAPSQLVGPQENITYTDAGTYQFAGAYRRADRGFQRLDEDVIDGFMNCTKSNPKGSRGTRRF